MADDKSKTTPQDAQRINVHEDYEVRSWCHCFGCTPEQLKAAVAIVGVMAKDVEKEVKSVPACGQVLERRQSIGWPSGYPVCIAAGPTAASDLFVLARELAAPGFQYAAASGRFFTAGLRQPAVCRGERMAMRSAFEPTVA